MKELLSLDNDYILESKFQEKKIRDPKNILHTVPDFCNEEKTMVNGNMIIDRVLFMREIFDQYGNSAGQFEMIWINKNDVLKLAAKIMDVESKVVAGYPSDNLPF